jgi:protein tyrosine phosphatase (PTP) superfamily phosphohydrolase (DUF442 family)
MKVQVIVAAIVATLLADTPGRSDEVGAPVTWGSTRATRIGHLWFAGQPDREGFEAAKAAGIEMLLNLREPSEGHEDDESVLGELGLPYHNVPVAKRGPFQPDAFDRIDELVEANEDKQVLIYCASGNRAGARYATHLARKHGMPIDAALAVVTESGISRAGVGNKVRAFMAADEARQRADAAARSLSQTLMQELTAAMEKGGTAEGVRVCSKVAQRTTAELGSELGVGVRRTALKVRNPANVADAFERSWLQDAADQVRGGGSPQPTRVVAAGDSGDELRALYPILFPGGVCSRCHGSEDEIDEETRALLRERYPQDEAIGFRKGDLRGAVSVRVPLHGAASVGGD